MKEDSTKAPLDFCAVRAAVRVAVSSIELFIDSRKKRKRKWAVSLFSVCYPKRLTYIKASRFLT
jgi:hypothetical protein